MVLLRLLLLTVTGTPFTPLHLSSQERVGAMVGAKVGASVTTNLDFFDTEAVTAMVITMINKASTTATHTRLPREQLLLDGVFVS